MHGEYKVPDGKLVAADVEVADGRLSRVRVSGDFFLEPDEALEELNRSLVGAAVNADTETLTGLIRAGMDPRARMVGFTAESVAVAVRRAVTGSTGWLDHEWRLVREPARSPLMHMALDQVLAEEVAAESRPPTLRFWEWAAPSVIIGSFQSVRNEVDMLAAENYGIEVVRRITGGGAMFVEPGNTVTYSLYAPSSLVAGMSFADSYAFLDDWVLEVLRELGLNVWYQPLNDITSDGGKIGGAAQKRVSAGAVLHHVTMSYDVDAEKLGQVLRVGGVKLSDKGVGSAVKRVDPLRRQTGLERGVVIDRLAEGFRSRYGSFDDRITDAEQRRAEELIAEKFATEDWFHRVP
ncbi:lipoate--protein ligase family protein [Actinopolyspora erythraea]|uniref:Lipoate--protein ligase n=1 Tax=Actinopolyspora erythraea TaxID=414996 RepID=A0A099D6I1_9ACTN|nr:biotin/lipoate A/B protein ligase family protein [Actinopolyspora erythraea]ASU78693.1 lipoate--protein ligase family protein [Actinopolyspora erythraea]KGI81447.1 lipoate--protein ligase [Actinopolyspora erythraea]